MMCRSWIETIELGGCLAHNLSSTMAISHFAFSNGKVYSSEVEALELV